MEGCKVPLLLMAAFLCHLACGCATSYNVATEQQESLFISTEREVRMGEAISRRVEEEYPPLRDPDLLARLDRIGQRMAAVSDRKDLVYRFAVIEEKEPNAFALPGGIIYVTTGLMELARSDDELASVLGHEMGHVTARHIPKRIQGAMGLQALQILVAASGAAPDPQARAGMDVALASVLSGYSQQDELEADRLGSRYVKRAGFRAAAAVDFLIRLRDHTYRQPSRRFSYFRTHPFFADRIRVVRQESSGEMTFDDYINIRE